MDRDCAPPHDCPMTATLEGSIRPAYLLPERPLSAVAQSIDADRSFGAVFGKFGPLPPLGSGGPLTITRKPCEATSVKNGRNAVPLASQPGPEKATIGRRRPR